MNKHERIEHIVFMQVNVPNVIGMNELYINENNIKSTQKRNHKKQSHIATINLYVCDTNKQKKN